MYISTHPSLWASLFLSGKFARAQQDVQEPFFTEGGEAECHNACTNLLNELGSIVHYGPSSELEGFSESFYSTFQREVQPACVITPTTAPKVAHTIRLLQPHSCHFAIKSGGHAQFAGASNAPGGITIDLRLLNQIEYLGAKDWDGTPVGDVKSKENGSDAWTGEITRLGPGARWRDVYEKLEPLGVSVVGGRASSVGVGGFVLGGGISFLSRRHGWALDNVRNFQLALPNGTLTNINHASSPDLYFALRGGSSNFGIVTRFDLETHKQGPAWGGYNFWIPPPSEISTRKQNLGLLEGKASPLAFSQLTDLGTLFKTLVNGLIRTACFTGYCVSITSFLQVFEIVVRAEQNDPFAQTFMTFGFVPQIDSWFMGGALVYGKELQNETYPKAFEGFKNMGKTVYKSNKLGNFTEIYRQVNGLNEEGYRQEWATLTFRLGPNTPTLLSGLIDIFISEVESIKHVKDLIPTIISQPINRDEIKLFAKNGGNCLGIDPDEGPLILFSTAFRHSLSTDTLIVQKANNNVITRAKELAKSLDLDHRYIYQNYANANQDVFAGYGEVNRQRLRRIQKGIDPEGWWGRGRERGGYFSI